MKTEINVLLAPGDRHHVIPLSTICPSRLSLRNISSALVCENSLSCTKKGKPYSTFSGWSLPRTKVRYEKTNNRFGLPRYGSFGKPNFQDKKQYIHHYQKITEKIPPLRIYGHEDNLKNGCTKKGNQCNVGKALPIMTGIFWHEVDYMILQKLCPQSCSSNGCNYANFDHVLDEAAILTIYAKNLPNYFETTWKKIIGDFQRKKGFKDIEIAVSVVEDNYKDFETAEPACTRLRFNKACKYANIYNSYHILKSAVQRNKKTRLVKDLRLYAKMDHAKMIEMQKDEMRHINVMRSIKDLDENLKHSVSGISRYFQGAAKFEESIANADVASIKGELDKYEVQMSDVQRELGKKLERIMKLMMALLSTNLAEKATQLTVLVAQESNPLKLLFNGPDAAAVLETAGEVADATSQVVKGTALIKSLNELTKDSLKLFRDFNQNAIQLSSLENVVSKIRHGKSSSIGQDAARFIEEYKKYSPKVSRSDIAKNNAFWSAFKEAACTLLEGDVGVGGAVPKSIAGSELLCERLEGVMAQFFTLREDIFDFQFQLVDSVTAIIQGNIEQRLAKEIKGKGDVLNVSELIVAYFLMQGKLQSVANLYCDVLEYKNRGQPVSVCTKAKNGFFKHGLDTLMAYKDTSPFTEVEREVFIPTRASFPGDTGYIDLAALGRGEDVVFKIPTNRTWLQHYYWVLAGQEAIPFLEDLEVFFPPNEKFIAERKLATTQVEISSVAGSSFLATKPDRKIDYILPSSHNKYLTVYDEGYNLCPLEIENPYSLCNNLPKICDRSKKIASQSLLPTVVSTWKIHLIIHQGSKQLKWDAPAPATNLLIRGKAKLRIPPRGGSKRRFKEYLFLRSSQSCCNGNKYRKSVHSRECTSCPRRSKSKYRGLYCEIAK